MKSDKLSLLNHCLLCKAKCCRISNLIGSPIISDNEAKNINKIKKDCLIKHVYNKEKYFTIKEKGNSKECIFLNQENKCLLQKFKPLDCLCYPIKAVYDKQGKIKFIIDSNCPASKSLDERFVKMAELIALESIRRFDKEAYNDWIDKFVGWARAK